MASNRSITTRRVGARTGIPIESMSVAYAALASRFGTFHLFGTSRGLLSIALPNESREAAESRLRRVLGAIEFVDDPDALAEALEQIEAYVDGSRREFDVALDPRGTAFQRAVWDAVSAVGYGETSTYGDIARAIGKPAAVRAVGAANGANPLPLIVPCHRIIGRDGTLTGYGGGLELKQRLLAFEGGER